jgi:hypothetical protein
MHLFLVAEPNMSAFAHLHPVQVRENVFEVKLPALPPGGFSVYADVNHESGLTQTLVAKATIPPRSGEKTALEPDEAVWSAQETGQIGSEQERVVILRSGATLRATAPLRFHAGGESILRFEPRGPDGQPLPLEPYLGMWSHAVVRSADGTVFTHLHPSGTISMASQELFARRERGEDLRKPLDVLCGRVDREFAFPYSFPGPGKYRIWVQLKSGGEILTAAYDIEVTAPAG